MKSFKCILIAVGLLASTEIYALDFPWLSFKMNDATEITVAADNLTMNYSDGDLMLTSASVSETLPVADIASMSFTTQQNGVDEINSTTRKPLPTRLKSISQATPAQ